MKKDEIKGMNRRQFLKVVGAAGGSLTLGEWGGKSALAAGKEVYPAEKILWICPYKAGAGFDLTARALSHYLTKYFPIVSPGAKGGEFVIKNMTEGGGVRAYNTIYHADPNGYTVGDFNIGFISNAIVSPTKLDFEIQKFTWLFRTGVTTRILIANKKGLSSWKEMLEVSKKRTSEVGRRWFRRGCPCRVDHREGGHANSGPFYQFWRCCGAG